MSDLRLLMGLSEEQTQAVLSDSPKILCLAGAGSGKTRVLTHRVARLVADRIGPYNILCLTFTRLAGKEMKERLIPLIGEQATRKVFCNTFHAFAVQVLKQWGRTIGIDQTFTIYDQDDRKDILEEIIADLKARTTVQKVLKKFPSPWVDLRLREVQESPENYEEAMVAKEYLYRCDQYNAIDLDSLIPRVNYLFGTIPQAREDYRKRYAYIFVDEFQDTSDDQIEMLGHLHPPNLFVVGDDYQAIYGWRGAKVEYILSFRQSVLGFGAEVITLEDNYRSTHQIVSLANRSIAHNQHQYKKTLRAHRNGPQINIKTFASEPQEYSGVISEINRLNGLGIPLHEIAVLARTNQKIDTLQPLLESMNIPSIKLANGDDVLSKPDVQKVLTWMKVLANKEDELSLKKVINWPYETFLRMELKKAEMTARQQDKPLIDVVMTPMLEEFIAKFEEAVREDYTPATWFKALVHLLNLKHYYTDRSLKTRLNDLVNAYNFIWEWQKTKEYFGEDYSPEAFLRWLKYRDIQEKLMTAKKNSVRLMTIHASKGLEFTAVILMGLSKMEFPSPRTKNIEEERRLFYVAVTRAKEHLTITHAKEVFDWNGQPHKTAESIFLAELEEKGGKD